MIAELKQNIIGNLINIPGYRTKRKIVVFESDDWGMIRMSSKEAYEDFLSKGYEVDKCPYSKNDALETNNDVEQLFEVLQSVRDKNGNPAKFTLNNIIGNPDFKLIKDSNFEQYHWETFITTLDRHPDSNNVFRLYREGIEKGLILPQFHGREHIGFGRWLDALKSGSQRHLDAFNYQMYAVHDKGAPSGNKDYLNSFVPERGYQDVIDRIKEGLDTFETLWGFRSKSIIAPCYTWNSTIESELFKEGVYYFQGGRAQIVPSLDKKRKIRYHFIGQRNSFNQIYLIRNVEFEPVESIYYDHVNNALKQINSAFKFRKPAIISSHRVNYIGSIHKENQAFGLKLLQILLKKIMEIWPDTIFMSTVELGTLISSKK